MRPVAAGLDEYLRTSTRRSRSTGSEIPRWVVDKLFDLGVLGMTIPREYGGLGMGITSYNRVLERIGHACGSTAVMVSAHQSIGCKAVMLFGTEDQKKKWLPHLAKDWLSAFCLSEPNVGCDAGGQETYFERDGDHFVVYGEKKWATSARSPACSPSWPARRPPDGARAGLRVRHAPRHARRRHLPEESEQVRHPRHLAGPHPLPRGACPASTSSARRAADSRWRSRA